jgi:hypothetical protein
MTELEMLRSCVEKIAAMVCGYVGRLEYPEPPAECMCFSCHARGCLKAIDTLKEMNR